MSYQLRDYQGVQKTAIIQALDTYRVVGVQLETGGGKTVLVASLIKDHEGYSVVAAHRDSLIVQISSTLGALGIYHNVVASKESIRELISQHMHKFKHSYYDPNARCIVVSIDTIINKDLHWFSRVTLVIIDEAHHVLRSNKWGVVFDKFKNAKGVLPTATPERADGCGLGAHADGFMETLIEGPPTSLLIERGFLVPTRVFSPPNNLDLSHVPLAASGEYSPRKLESAVRESNIMGDVVQHYLKNCSGKLGLTFAVSIDAAAEYAYQFNAEGVPAAVICGKTPKAIQVELRRKFENRDLLQLCTVDLFTEGVDIPAAECGSLCCPTNSYSKYKQQIGRLVRTAPRKLFATINDHVGNTRRHGFYHAPRVWSLDRRDKRSKSKLTKVLTRICKNPDCCCEYEKNLKACPNCGDIWVPVDRGSPAAVEGDLVELNPDVLKTIQKEIARIAAPPRISLYHEPVVRYAIAKTHRERYEAQQLLRDAIAKWAGPKHAEGASDSDIYMDFYARFGLDMASALTLPKKESQVLVNKIGEAY